jgi:hypothetical protein
LLRLSNDVVIVGNVQHSVQRAFYIRFRGLYFRSKTFIVIPINIGSKQKISTKLSKSIIQTNEKTYAEFCNAMARMDSLECLVYWDLVNLLVSDRGIYTS